MCLEERTSGEVKDQVGHRDGRGLNDCEAHNSKALRYHVNCSL